MVVNGKRVWESIDQQTMVGLYLLAVVESRGRRGGIITHEVRAMGDEMILTVMRDIQG